MLRGQAIDCDGGSAALLVRVHLHVYVPTCSQRKTQLLAAGEWLCWLTCRPSIRWKRGSWGADVADAAPVMLPVLYLRQLLPECRLCVCLGLPLNCEVRLLRWRSAVRAMSKLPATQRHGTEVRELSYASAPPSGR